MSYFRLLCLWGRVDSNHRTLPRTDLQSVAIAAMRLPHCLFNLLKFASRWRDSNPRPRDYKSRALANWATSALVVSLFSNNSFCFRVAKIVLFFILHKLFCSNFPHLFTTKWLSKKYIEKKYLLFHSLIRQIACKNGIFTLKQAVFVLVLAIFCIFSNKQLIISILIYI